MSNEVNGQKNVIRFNKDLAKKISQETFDDNGPADSQGIEIKSPGKMHWFTVHGESFEDLIPVHTTKLYDPDGELEEYIILVEDKSLREKIFNKADDNVNVKALVRCTNWFGSVGWQSWSHPGTDKIPEWSKMSDEEIINQVFDRRIITSLDHEALERNVGGK